MKSLVSYLRLPFVMLIVYITILTPTVFIVNSHFDRYLSLKNLENVSLYQKYPTSFQKRIYESKTFAIFSLLNGLLLLATLIVFCFAKTSNSIKLFVMITYLVVYGVSAPVIWNSIENAQYSSSFMGYDDWRHTSSAIQQCISGVDAVDPCIKMISRILPIWQLFFIYLMGMLYIIASSFDLCWKCLDMTLRIFIPLSIYCLVSAIAKDLNYEENIAKTMGCFAATLTLFLKFIKACDGVYNGISRFFIVLVLYVLVKHRNVEKSYSALSITALIFLITSLGYHPAPVFSEFLIVSTIVFIDFLIKLSSRHTLSEFLLKNLRTIEFFLFLVTFLLLFFYVTYLKFFYIYNDFTPTTIEFITQHFGNKISLPLEYPTNPLPEVFPNFAYLTDNKIQFVNFFTNNLVYYSIGYVPLLYTITGGLIIIQKVLFNLKLSQRKEFLNQQIVNIIQSRIAHLFVCTLTVFLFLYLKLYHFIRYLLEISPLMISDFTLLTVLRYSLFFILIPLSSICSAGIGAYFVFRQIREAKHFLVRMTILCIILFSILLCSYSYYIFFRYPFVVPKEQYLCYNWVARKTPLNEVIASLPEEADTLRYLGERPVPSSNELYDHIIFCREVYNLWVQTSIDAFTLFFTNNLKLFRKIVDLYGIKYVYLYKPSYNSFKFQKRAYHEPVYSQIKKIIASSEKSVLEKELDLTNRIFDNGFNVIYFLDQPIRD